MKAKRRNRIMFQPATWKLYLMLLVPFVLYIGLTFFPLGYGMFCSLFRRVGLTKNKFVGLENYLALWRDGKWWLSVKNTFSIMVMCVIGQIGIGLMFTVFMSFRWIRMKGFHRTLMFLPSIISGVVMGFIWQLIFSDRLGLLNSILRGLGLSTYAWLAETSTILLVVTIPTVWQCVGYYMILMLGGISGIDNSVFEAAEIDGASDTQLARFITVPLLKDTILVAMLVCVSGTLKIFDHINIMTNGGPGSASMVMAQYAYNTTFTAFNQGYGATISVGMFVITMVSVLIVRRFLTGGSKNA